MAKGQEWINLHIKQKKKFLGYISKIWINSQEMPFDINAWFSIRTPMLVMIEWELYRNR